MKTYPNDKETGKPLIRSGFHVNATSPMTQEEVNLQHELVNKFLETNYDDERIEG